MNSLANRITITLISFALIVALFIAWLGFTLNENLERALWRSALETEFNNYLWQHNKNKLNGDEISYPESVNLKTYIWYKGTKKPKSIPDAITAMQAGIHDEVTLKNGEYSILVREIEGDKIYMSYDITLLEQHEKQLTLIIVFLILATTLIIIFISIFLSRNLTKQVIDLAKRVNKLNPAERGLTLNTHYNEKEISIIASAIDSYLERMDGFMDREKDFLDAASHELRTPIAIISGASEVLEANSKIPDSAKPTLSRLQHAAHNMEETVNALFYLAKDSIHLNLQAENVDIKSLIEKSISDYQPLIKQKSLNLQLTLTETLVHAHYGMVAIVINNLIRNAIEHTEKGSVYITIENEVVTIVNTGNNISPDELSTIFQKRVRGSGSQQNEGSGLGLYIIERICRQLGWRLTLSFDDKNGTTASIDLSQLRL